VEAVKLGLADGTVDAIATDHAPHAPESRDLPFDQAPPGMLGLQTALALAVSELDLPLQRVLALLSWQPAALVGLDPIGGGGQGGPIVPGAPANLCVIDPTATWTVDPSALASRSRNTPYAGRRLTGQVRHTVFRGEPVVIDAEAQR
jgi:dihydroorotase